MKAIVYDRYGSPDVLRLEEIPKPTPGDGEVLVRVRAAAVNPYDWHVMRGLPYLLRVQMGLRRPKVHGLGVDVAGEVDAVGGNVTRFRPGDEVFGLIAECRWGAFTEYTCVPQDWLEPKPANLTFAQAVAAPLAGLTALQGLRDYGKIAPGQQVLIIGASGGVGTFAVQFARWHGAEVTGVCSTKNVDLVRSLGAAEVIDYTEEDFTRRGPRYDLIFQLAGTRSPSDCRRALKPGGTFVQSSGEGGGRWIGPMGRIARALMLSLFVKEHLVAFVTRRSSDDLRLLRELLEAEKLSPVIDREYELSGVPEAIRYVEEGHARGKVVITVVTA